jgi:hypothetical protein
LEPVVVVAVDWRLEVVVEFVVVPDFGLRGLAVVVVVPVVVPLPAPDCSHMEPV